MNARRVVVTARMAQDLTLGALLGGGSNKVYLEITLGDKTRTTSKAKLEGTTAVFDQTLDFELPPEQPDENVELRVTVKAATMKLFKDRTVASGVSGVKDTFITGSEEAKVYLADSNGKPAGLVFVGLQMAALKSEEIPSAAGTVLGEVPRPKGLAAEGKAKPDVVPSSEVQPTTPSLGAIMPGALDDPSSPTYGILKE